MKKKKKNTESGVCNLPRTKQSRSFLRNLKKKQQQNKKATV